MPPPTQSSRRKRGPPGAAAAAEKAAGRLLLLALPLLLLLLLAPLPLAGAQATAPVPYAMRFGATNGEEVVRATAVDASGNNYVVGCVCVRACMRAIRSASCFIV